MNIVCPGEVGALMKIPVLWKLFCIFTLSYPSSLPSVVYNILKVIATLKILNNILLVTLYGRVE